MRNAPILFKQFLCAFKCLSILTTSLCQLLIFGHSVHNKEGQAETFMSSYGFNILIIFSDQMQAYSDRLQVPLLRSRKAPRLTAKTAAWNLFWQKKTCLAVRFAEENHLCCPVLHRGLTSFYLQGTLPLTTCVLHNSYAQMIMGRADTMDAFAWHLAFWKGSALIDISWFTESRSCCC